MAGDGMGQAAVRHSRPADDRGGRDPAQGLGLRLGVFLATYLFLGEGGAPARTRARRPLRHAVETSTVFEVPLAHRWTYTSAALSASHDAFSFDTGNDRYLLSRDLQLLGPLPATSAAVEDEASSQVPANASPSGCSGAR